MPPPTTVPARGSTGGRDFHRGQQQTPRCVHGTPRNHDTAVPPLTAATLDCTYSIIAVCVRRLHVLRSHLATYKAAKTVFKGAVSD